MPILRIFLGSVFQPDRRFHPSFVSSNFDLSGFRSGNGIIFFSCTNFSKFGEKRRISIDYCACTRILREREREETRECLGKGFDGKIRGKWIGSKRVVFETLTLNSSRLSLPKRVWRAVRAVNVLVDGCRDPREALHIFTPN